MLAEQTECVRWCEICVVKVLPRKCNLLSLSIKLRSLMHLSSYHQWWSGYKASLQKVKISICILCVKLLDSPVGVRKCISLHVFSKGDPKQNADNISKLNYWEKTIDFIWYCIWNKLDNMCENKKGLFNCIYLFYF